jgi:hypothetical protein
VLPWPPDIGPELAETGLHPSPLPPLFLYLQLEAGML